MQSTKAVTFSARTCRTLESIANGKSVCDSGRYRKCKSSGYCNLLEFTKKSIEPGVRSVKALQKCRKIRVVNIIFVEDV